MKQQIIGVDWRRFNMSKEEKRRLRVLNIYDHNASMRLDKEREAKRLAKVYKETNKEHEEWRASVQRQNKRGQQWLYSKIYIQLDGKTCLFEIIIGYYIHTMLLQAIACKKKLQRLQ
jgi:hypothetical protein